jgi:hypothetical protein
LDVGIQKREREKNQENFQIAGSSKDWIYDCGKTGGAWEAGQVWGKIR